MACVNVAGLFSAGAQPADLVRHLLTESLLYALRGGATGLFVGEHAIFMMKKRAF